MPIVKVKREDILREDEFREMLSKLEDKDTIIGEYETTLHGEPVVQKFHIKCKQTQCLLCLLWIFGKRIQEILLLRRKDLYVEDGFLFVDFIVLKKKKRKSVRERYTKRITLEHPYTHYITDHMSSINDPNAYIFPGGSRPRKFVSKVNVYEYSTDEKGNVRRKLKDTKIYQYERSERGFMSSQLAWKIIKFLNPNVYPHLFRHSLATRMAKHSFTEDQLMSWFDWDSPKIAHEYVERGPRLTEQASRRTW